MKIVFNESVVEKIKELEEEFELIREELNEIVFENEIFRSKMQVLEYKVFFFDKFQSDYEVLKLEMELLKGNVV